MAYRDLQFYKNKQELEIVEMILRTYDYKKNLLYAFTKTK